MKKSCSFVVQENALQANVSIQQTFKKQAGQEGESPSVYSLRYIRDAFSCGDPAFILPQNIITMQENEKTNVIVSVIARTMTSREIAELTGKPHNDVLKAIRAMESAWENVNGGKFSLVEYTDGKGEKRPQYHLTKTECLYIATKFNDEARARLIIRWQELEEAAPGVALDKISRRDLALMIIQAEEEKERLCVQTQLQQKQLKEAAPKVEYYEEVLQSPTAIQTTIIAKELGMSAGALNSRLKRLNIIYRSGKTWVPYSKYQSLGYTKSRTYTYTDQFGGTQTSIHTYWTEKGREFILKTMGAVFAKEAEKNAKRMY